MAEKTKFYVYAETGDEELTLLFHSKQDALNFVTACCESDEKFLRVAITKRTFEEGEKQ